MSRSSAPGTPAGDGGREEEPTPVDGLTVLVVEDDETTAMVERKLLEHEGFRVLQAHNGQRALEHLEECSSLAVIVLDYFLPDMTGADIVAALGERIASLPVVMVTGYADPEMEEQMRAAGVFDYVVKGMDLKFLEEMVAAAKAAVHRV